MIRIALLGGPSAGKSTLAARLFSDLKEIGKNAELVQEYAREHINRRGVITNVLSQYMIYERQRDREDILPEQVEYLVTDSPTILSYIYAVHYADLTNVDNQELIIDMYDKMFRDGGVNRYKYIYFLEPTRPYKLDGTRSQTESEARHIGENIKKFLELHHITYKSLSMSATHDRAVQIKKDLRV